RRNTTRSLSVVCSICRTGCQSPASPSSPHRMLRRSSWSPDPGAPRFRFRRAHYMRQSLPIPCSPFSASPRAMTILAASGSKHSMRRTSDMHPPHPFPIADVHPRHNSPTRTSVLSAPPPLAHRAAPGSEEGQHGRLQREIAAQTQREDTPQWAPAAIAGTGARIGDSSNAISADFFDTST
ncbi:hypothetical protein B0H14DRAFT_2757025, partial [Mycena olivaceomarginata]